MEHKCNKSGVKAIEKCELNREQIIKALESCTNCTCNHAKTDTECPLVKMDFCKNYLMKQSLSLIKELTEENKRLKKYEIAYETPLGKQTMPNLLSLEGEAARLYTQIQNKVKADTVRKMQDMVAVHFGTYTDTDTVKVLDVFRLLGKIAKEMLEGAK